MPWITAGLRAPRRARSAHEYECHPAVINEAVVEEMQWFSDERRREILLDRDALLHDSVRVEARMTPACRPWGGSRNRSRCSSSLEAGARSIRSMTSRARRS